MFPERKYNSFPGFVLKGIIKTSEQYCLGNKYPFTLSIYMAKDLTHFSISFVVPITHLQLSCHHCLLESAAWIPDNPQSHHPKGRCSSFPCETLVYLSCNYLSSNSISIPTESPKTFIWMQFAEHGTWLKINGFMPTLVCILPKIISVILSQSVLYFCWISFLLISKRKDIIFTNLRQNKTRDRCRVLILTQDVFFITWTDFPRGKFTETWCIDITLCYYF